MWFQNGQRVALKLRVASIGRLSIAQLVKKMFNMHSRTREKSITFVHLPAIVNGLKVCLSWCVSCVPPF